METVSIYKVTDSTNGIIYVGQTVQILRRRWSRHLYDAIVKKAPQDFHQAIRDHGKDSFVIEKIDEAHSREDGNELETFYIAHFNATDPSVGYNRMLGGRAGRHLPENKVKISKKSKEWWQNPENKKRASESRKGLLIGERNPMFGRHDLGQPHTDEIKKLIGDKCKERWKDPEYAARMSAANMGKHHTPEGRANIAKNHTGNHKLGTKQTEATKAKIKASMERSWDRKRATFLLDSLQEVPHD